MLNNILGLSTHAHHMIILPRQGKLSGNGTGIRIGKRALQLSYQRSEIDEADVQTDTYRLTVFPAGPSKPHRFFIRLDLFDRIDRLINVLVWSAHRDIM